MSTPAVKPWTKAEKSEPFLTKLTAFDMDNFLRAVHSWVLDHCHGSRMHNSFCMCLAQVSSERNTMNE